LLRRERNQRFLMCLGENLERKRERICPRKFVQMPKIVLLLLLLLFYLRGSWVLYSKKVTCRLPVAT